MRPDNVAVKTEGSFPGKDIDMKFSREGLIYAIQVMTNMYSDTELAVIREYSANARDSHVEAGQTRPIEVTVKGSMMEAYELIIEDFGVGLSVNDIETVYALYGESTKRQSNSLIGAFGIGGKSARTRKAAS